MGKEFTAPTIYNIIIYTAVLVKYHLDISISVNNLCLAIDEKKKLYVFINSLAWRRTADRFLKTSRVRGYCS